MYISLFNGIKSDGFVWSRYVEGIIESSAQSLFQLYITIQNSENNTFYTQFYYYLSIFVSILSLSFCLLTFEFHIYSYHYKFPADRDFRARDELPGLKEISYFSKYSLVLFLYRASEIISRMFILCAFGHYTTGYNVIYILLSSWVVMNIITFYRMKTDPKCDFLDMPCMILAFMMSLCNILFLPVYCVPLCTNLWSLKNQYFNQEFLLKFIEHIFMAVVIYFNLDKIDHTIAYSVYMISNAALVIKYISLYFICKWTNKENMKNYISNFESMTCCN